MQIKEELEFITPSGIALKLQPYQKENNIEYYEIIGEEGNLSDATKAQLLVHICKSQRHLMQRWSKEMRSMLPEGDNTFGITLDGRLIVKKDDVPSVIFAFDKNKQEALLKLSQAMAKACTLSPGLILNAEQRELTLSGQNFTTEDCLKLSTYIFRIPNANILVVERFPPKGMNQLSKSQSDIFAFFATKGLFKHSAVMPLSAINILLKHFNLPFEFPYLGDKENNFEILVSSLRGFTLSNPGQSLANSFFKDIVESELLLNGVSLNNSLASLDQKKCNYTSNDFIIPKSKL